MSLMALAHNVMFGGAAPVAGPGTTTTTAASNPTPPVDRRRTAPAEVHAEKDPKRRCKAGEHGACKVEGCKCWCHLERVS